MADENKKALKQAEKDAQKAKKDRIKQSKPKKQGNIFQRILAAIKKFFKDFKGICKKVIWPDRKTVLKNSAIVFVAIIVIGAGIWIADFAFTRSIRGIENAIDNAQEKKAEEVSEENEEAVSNTDVANLLDGVSVETVTG